MNEFVKRFQNTRFHNKIFQSQLVDAECIKRLRHPIEKIKSCCNLASI